MAHGSSSKGKVRNAKGEKASLEYTKKRAKYSLG